MSTKDTETQASKARENDQESGQGVRAKRVYVLAGEDSGDLLGASLMSALQTMAESQKHSLEFFGIGGPNMQRQGLSPVFPMSELSLMGLMEVVPHVLNLVTRAEEVLDDIKRVKPDVLVTIDAPGFNMRIARRVKSLNIPVVHYVAPSVWAWRPRRAERIAQFLDHVLCLFPFEPEYFTRQGLAATYVGHPLVDEPLQDTSPEAFCKTHEVADAPVLCVMPGSRQRELDRHLTVFADTVSLLRTTYPDLRLVVPTLPHLRDRVEDFFNGRGLNAILVTEPEEKYAAIRASRAALVASGTATLEVGLCETPMVVAYRAHPVTALVVKILLRTEHVSLVNIVLDEAVVPELLQEKCTADNLAHHLRPLLDLKAQARKDCTEKLASLPALLRAGHGSDDDAETSSERAAQVVMRYLGLTDQAVEKGS